MSPQGDFLEGGIAITYMGFSIGFLRELLAVLLAVSAAGTVQDLGRMATSFDSLHFWHCGQELKVQDYDH